MKKKLPYSLEQAIWIFYKRYYFKKKIRGFFAHWKTFAGGNLIFSEFNRIFKGSYLTDVTLGRFTYVNGAKISKTILGSFCSIGPEALIGGLGSHPTHFLSTYPVFYSSKNIFGVSFLADSIFEEHSKTVLGNDVWVGTRSIILDGVNVGDGAVVAANAVVTTNVPPFAIVGGVPAKIIRYRFSEAVREFLLTWQWWHLPIWVLQIMAGEFIAKEDWEIDDVKRLSTLSLQLLEKSYDSKA